MPKEYGTPGPRFLYPEACTSRSLAACDPMAQLLFDRLLTQCDDQGRLEGDSSVIRALCMPLIARATPRAVERWLVELDKERMILRYQSKERPLVQIANWWSYQGGMRRSYPSRWPSPKDWEGDRIRGVAGGDSPPEGGNGGQSGADGGKTPPPRAQAPAGAEPSQAEPTQSRAEPDTGGGLPAEGDTATLACRFFPDGGSWLGNRAYVQGWEELDRLYTPEWVQAELQPTYAAMLNGKRVRPWDYLHRVDARCAERARAEFLNEKERTRLADVAEKERVDAAVKELTPEGQEQLDLQRRAIALWQAEGKEARLPTDLAELRTYVEEHEATIP